MGDGHLGRIFPACRTVETRQAIPMSPVPRGNLSGSVTAVTLRRWTTMSAASRKARHHVKEAIVWKGDTRPHARQDGQASSVRRTWNPAETKKARSVVALSCVTRFGRGRRFASGYWSVLQGSAISRCPQRLAFFRPLVRRSADQHATTGTCEIGQALYRSIVPAMQEKPAPCGENFSASLNVFRQGASGPAAGHSGPRKSRTGPWPRRQWPARDGPAPQAEWPRH